MNSFRDANSANKNNQGHFSNTPNRPFPTRYILSKTPDLLPITSRCFPFLSIPVITEQQVKQADRWQQTERAQAEVAKMRRTKTFKAVLENTEVLARTFSLLSFGVFFIGGAIEVIAKTSFLSVGETGLYISLASGAVSLAASSVLRRM